MNYHFSDEHGEEYCLMNTKSGELYRPCDVTTCQTQGSKKELVLRLRQIAHDNGLIFVRIKHPKFELDRVPEIPVSYGIFESLVWQILKIGADSNSNESSPMLSKRLVYPPGTRVRVLFEWLLSKRIRTNVTDQQIGDMIEEYFEALAAGKPWLARFVVIRGHIAIFASLALLALHLISGKTRKTPIE